MVTSFMIPFSSKFTIPFCSSNHFVPIVLSMLVKHLPLRVFFNNKLGDYPYRIPTFLAALAYYKGITFYPPKV
jgi:hypothetical protein